jgi:hypothetical protein
MSYSDKIIGYRKESLKIRKRYSKAVNRRGDNTCTMAKEKVKIQTMIYKTIFRKLEIEQHEPHKKLGVKSGATEGCHFCLGHGQQPYVSEPIAK